jgi:peptide/nickel transport system permease protein
MLALALLIALGFALPRLLPGDPLVLMLPPDAARGLSPQEETALRAQMGLSGAVQEQFVHYLGALIQGDLGFSFRHAARVVDVLSEALPWSALLVVCAVPVYVVVSVASGIAAGRRPHSRVDHWITSGMVVLSSTPPFVGAVFLLQLFGITWPLLPMGGAEPLFPPGDPVGRALSIASHAVLPVLALSLHELTHFFFLARGEAVTLAARSFIVNARSRGIGELRLVLHYYGRNLVPALLARLGSSVSGLFGALVFVEIIFSYPGIGNLVYSAIQERDYPLLQGALLVLAMVVLALNWLIDSLAFALAARR